MHVGKNLKSINCVMNGGVLEQVSQFKYLSCENKDGKFNKEFEHRRVNGNKVIAQLRTHGFNES